MVNWGHILITYFYPAWPKANDGIVNFFLKPFGLQADFKTYSRAHF